MGLLANPGAALLIKVFIWTAKRTSSSIRALVRFSKTSTEQIFRNAGFGGGLRR